jgi:hypothetical protein
MKTLWYRFLAWARAQFDEQIALPRREDSERIADLERRLKEAERDAGRYRWLREHGTSVTLPRVYDEKYEAVMWIALDKAIDSAMGKEPG